MAMAERLRLQSTVSLCALLHGNADAVRVYAQAAEADVRHLRTARGEREVDLIVEGRGGEIVALEVKLSATVDDADVRHLRWLSDELAGDFRAGAVLTTGPQAYRRQDGVFVVPLALLGP